MLGPHPCLQCILEGGRIIVPEARQPGMLQLCYVVNVMLTDQETQHACQLMLTTLV